MRAFSKSLAGLLALVVTAAIWAASAASAASADVAISGDYLEARTADVWTGPCFANAEVGLLGLEAVLAWRVEAGSWNGVDLAGLSVVAVVAAEATLGDPYADPGAVRSQLLVDERADAAEQRALAAFVRAATGRLLADVVSIESVPIRFTRDADRAAASLDAGAAVRVATRPLGHHDHHCGNETVYYPPLVALADAAPAVTLDHVYQPATGAGLGRSWSSPGRRSAFVGRFEH